MRFVKLAVISFVLLFVVITLISLFIPSTVKISKAINIHTSPDSVWSKVGNKQSWPKWNRLSINEQIDWIKKEHDEHIARIPAGSSYMLSGWRCILYSGTDSLTVQWYLDISLKWYPWEKFRSLLFEKTYGPEMEQGLTNLKILLEK